MKIPILWRIERWIENRKEKNSEEVKPNKTLSKHKRSYNRVCPKCNNQKWIKRKNSEKCTKCGYKVYIGKELVEYKMY